MRKSSLVIVIMLSAWLLMAGCNADEGLQQEGKPVVVDLALTVSNATQETTRMAAADVQADGNYRGISMTRIVPFNVHGKITVDDMPTWYQISNVRTDYLRTDKFYLYTGCMIMEGAASFLTYGRAPQGSLTKAANGSVIETFPLNMAPKDIRFSLEPIATPTEHPTATALANYMTSIATAKGNAIAWKDAPSNVLKTMFLNFVNQIEAVSGGNILPGSSANIYTYTQNLKSVLNGLTLTNGDDIAIRTAIIEKIDDLYNTNWDGFPASIGLPDGAAVIRWNGTSFTPQISYTSLADINGVNRFTYPAEIYYYGNSRIATSNIDDRQEVYENENNKEWDEVLTSGYEYQDNATVTHNTRSIAIKEPMQYGVARLQVKLLPTTSTLKDAKNNSVTIMEKKSFPLTGIIVGGQMPVGFDFSPTTSYPVYSESAMMYIYDSQVKTSGTSGDEYFYLSAYENPKMTNTLVLQSYDHKIVPIVLEFINDSDKDFVGLDGIVYRGTKFYLVAEIDPEQFKDDPRTDIRDRVFTQDFTTTLNMRVTGLSKAYNVVPNLLSPRLELGIELVSQWASTTPEEIIF